MSQLEAQFHQAMIDIYVTAQRDCKYNATYFLAMVTEHGGLEAARRLLAAENTSDGFGTLLLCGRLDLTVEAHVLKPEFRQLFSPEEITVATKRLQEFKYKFAR
jgi:hypothetical protein